MLHKTLLALVTTLALVGSATAAVDDVHDAARKLAKDDDFAGATELLRAHLKREPSDALGHDLVGQYLHELGRGDEAAHHLDAARGQYLASGNKRAADKVERVLARADPLWRKTESLFGRQVRELMRAAEKLADAEQPVRALAMYERLLEVAEDKNRRQIEAAIAKLRSAGAEVDLDSAASEAGPDGEWPMVEEESKYYKLHFALEPDVIARLSETLDSIYLYFTDVYLDGKLKKGSTLKIYIHANWDNMMNHYPGAPTPGIGGWFSPGSNEIHCYDTRGREGTLDGMMETLFHELGHQFMNKLTRGEVPSWFNEGTSCFFEGAIAMADGSVTWPDAALSRLTSLRGMLADEARGKQLLKEAIGYDGAGSYAGQYYPVGWGIVYFLQQWEHPETLEYSFRPLYNEYRDRITSKGGSSREVFDEVMLTESSPLGHETFDDFYRDWRAWIIETVASYHPATSTPEKARALRMEQLVRYIERAEVVQDERKPLVSEREYLERALRNVEYIRSKIDGQDEIDFTLIDMQATVLERLERGKNAAPLVELLLDQADEGAYEIDEASYTALEERLARLDKRNSALRLARGRERTATIAARRLLDDYLEHDPPMPLRAYAFAARAGKFTDDKVELLPKAEELRALARERGLLLGRVLPLHGKLSEWVTVWSDADEKFESDPESIELECVRPHGKLLQSIPVSGEYELRATIHRKGKLRLGTAHGLVVAGTPSGKWAMVGFDSDGHVKLYTVEPGTSSARVRRNRSLTLSRRIAEDEDPQVTLHVYPDDQLEIRVQGRDPIMTRLPFEAPRKRYVGVFARDGKAIFEQPVVEVYP